MFWDNCGNIDDQATKSTDGYTYQLYASTRNCIKLWSWSYRIMSKQKDFNWQTVTTDDEIINAMLFMLGIWLKEEKWVNMRK